MGLISYAQDHLANNRFKSDSKAIQQFLEVKSLPDMARFSIAQTAAKDFFRFLMDEFSMENMACLNYMIALSKNPRKSHIDILNTTFIKANAPYEINLPNNTRNDFAEFQDDLMLGSGSQLASRFQKITNGDMSSMETSQLLSALTPVVLQTKMNLIDTYARFKGLKTGSQFTKLRSAKIRNSGDFSSYQTLINQMNSKGFRCDTFPMGKWFRLFFS